MPRSLGPDLDLTWDLDPDLSLTKRKQALEHGDVFYAQEDEVKFAYLAPTEAHIHYYVQSPQDNAVKAWLIVPESRALLTS